MKRELSLSALAVLMVLGGVALAPASAHAVSYVDGAGRAYYFNNWGQKVYYDTGYNEPMTTVVREQSSYNYYYPNRSDRADTTTYVEETPEATTTTTYVNTKPARPCRNVQHTVMINGDLQQETSSECLQPDGNWAEAY